MARKNIVVTPIALNQALSTDFISSVTNIKYLDNIAYQINLTTTDSIGTFEIQGSVDYAQYEPTNVVENPGEWVTLTLDGGTPFVNAADDQILVDLNQLPFTALRVKYNSTTPGTGTCAIYLIAKQLGG